MRASSSCPVAAVYSGLLQSWGYADPNLRRDIGNALATVLLLAGSPRLDSLQYEHLELARRLAPSVFLRGHFLKLSRALVLSWVCSARRCRSIQRATHFLEATPCIGQACRLNGCPLRSAGGS